MAEPVGVSFRGETDDRIEITLLCRAQSDIEDFADGNWLSALIEVRAGGFRGDVAATLRAEELHAFDAAARELYRTLKGQAAFRTMEEQLEIVLISDGWGHIEVTGFVRDGIEKANRLEFRFTIDQTFLKRSLRALARVTAAFPVVG